MGALPDAARWLHCLPVTGTVSVRSTRLAQTGPSDWWESVLDLVDLY